MRFRRLKLNSSSRGDPGAFYEKKENQPPPRGPWLKGQLALNEIAGRVIRVFARTKNGASPAEASEALLPIPVKREKQNKGFKM